jgi:hypothetical protein
MHDMPKLTVHFAKVPAVDLGSPAPGLRSVGQETDNFALDLPSEPKDWTTGDPIKSLLTTMADIAGRKKPGSTFRLQRVWTGNRVVVVMFLTSDDNGPRLWTEPFWIRRELFEDWWARNVMPPTPPGPAH